jgi:carboxyl-terminal processing protease
VTRARPWVIFSGGVICGVVISAVSATARASDADVAYKKLRVFSQVLTYVQASYVDDVDPQRLIYDAIVGMLSRLDPHTQFLPAEMYEKLREDTAGEFGGLGIDVGAVGDGPEARLVIEAVRPDGPGAHAGLKAGDLIVAVDGTPLRGEPLEVGVRLMRGVPGTRVVLTVSRDQWSKPRDVPMIRRHVRVVSVERDLLSAPDAPAIGYVAISSFQERTDQELGAALTDLRRQARAAGSDQLGGLILDLRDNPGGLLDEGVKVADRFLARGLIVRTEGRDPKSADQELAHADGTEPDYPVVVLVNGYTASASEIVAGALQDHKRAVVVGERSFGKGSVQTLYGLDDGAGLKLTVARYFTPSGRSIQGSGVVPDLVVRPSPSVQLGVRGPARVAVDAQLAAAVESVRMRR